MIEETNNESQAISEGASPTATQGAHSEGDTVAVEAPASTEEAVAVEAQSEEPAPAEQAADPEAEQVAEQAAEQATDGEAPAEAESAPEPPAVKSWWYAIHAYSGMEQKVLRNIQYRLEIEGLSQGVARMLVPTHTVIEIKDGKKHQMEKNLMPGYVLIEVTCQGDEFKEIVEEISKLGGVAGFVGDGTDPIPLGDHEVEGLLSQTSHRQDKPKTEMEFTRGQVVKIIEGAFAGFTGSVDGMDPQRGKLSVMVSIFGRQTAVELDVLQVDKS